MLHRYIHTNVYVACIVEMRNAYKVLVGIPEGNRLLRKYSHTCEGNIKLDLKEMILRLWTGFS
jgi:hypothetical protein